MRSRGSDIIIWKRDLILPEKIAKLFLRDHTKECADFEIIYDGLRMNFFPNSRRKFLEMCFQITLPSNFSSGIDGGAWEENNAQLLKSWNVKCQCSVLHLKSHSKFRNLVERKHTTALKARLQKVNDSGIFRIRQKINAALLILLTNVINLAWWSCYWRKHKRDF